MEKTALSDLGCQNSPEHDEDRMSYCAPSFEVLGFWRRLEFGRVIWEIRTRGPSIDRGVKSFTRLGFNGWIGRGIDCLQRASAG